MLIELRGGQVINGAELDEQDAKESGERASSIYLLDGLISVSKPDGVKIDESHDVSGHILMAGGIDLHTHIGGGKVNIARMLVPDLSLRPSAHQSDSKPWLGHEGSSRPLSSPVPGTWETGKRYLQMGYTTCFEPAVLPANARQSHAEMADTPWLDTGGYLLLGNDRILLEWIASAVPQTQINDYVGWMLRAHQCCAVKVVNAGGIDAFKFNQRAMDLDTPHVHFGITPRQILKTLAMAVDELKLAHPLHVHCSNLGMPGNIETTLETIHAVEGRRIHLTHAQFHCYGTHPVHEFSSAAERLAEEVNARPNISIDVGQVLFGQTVTLSADTMHQYEHRRLARPRKCIFQDLECQAGCGVVPFRYRHSQFVHGLQWAIGLELFLRIDDSSRVFLTTDHPNGGPFTSYPHLIRLLMEYDFRMSVFEQLHPEVKRLSPLASLKRELTLSEIASMTRSGPAKSLGLSKHGQITDGFVADIAVYPKSTNVESMFCNPSMVFRKGSLVYRDQVFVNDCVKSTWITELDIDTSIDRNMKAEYVRRYGYSPQMTSIHRDELVPSDQFDVAITNKS